MVWSSFVLSAAGVPIGVSVATWCWLGMTTTCAASLLQHRFRSSTSHRLHCLAPTPAPPVVRLRCQLQRFVFTSMIISSSPAADFYCCLRCISSLDCWASFLTTVRSKRIADERYLTRRNLAVPAVRGFSQHFYLFILHWVLHTIFCEYEYEYNKLARCSRPFADYDRIWKTNGIHRNLQLNQRKLNRWFRVVDSIHAETLSEPLEGEECIQVHGR